MVFNKRGQAAMEFLMTYGWAILVVLVAIAALAYFGVLSPARFLPERCLLAPGLACLDHSVSAASGVSLVVQNSLGYDLNDLSVGVCGGSDSLPTLANGAQDTLVVVCSPLLEEGNQLKSALNITYTNADTLLAHSTSGDLAARVGA